MCLDANVVIDLMRGENRVASRMRDAIMSGEAVVTSSIVLEELAFGAAVSTRPAVQRRALDLALTNVEVVALTREDAARIGEYRARQNGSGRKLAAYDGLIAGHAHARGWTLATSDEKLAAAAQDIVIENWRAPE